MVTFVNKKTYVSNFCIIIFLFSIAHYSAVAKSSSKRFARFTVAKFLANFASINFASNISD